MYKKVPLKKIVLYLSGTLTGILLGVSIQSFAATTNPNTPLPIKDIRTFAEVYGHIKANYYKNTNDSKLIQNAIKGMVSRLDPHSDYMTKKEFQDFQNSTSGQFGGLGIEIAPRDNGILVIAPIEDTPAERAGIKSGDYILKINGKSTMGMSVFQAVKLMRGKPGTSLTITVGHKGLAPKVVHITRAIIKVKSVRGSMLKKDYAYIRISQFQPNTLKELANKINELRNENQEPFKGLILDLRNDPGGLLNAAVGVSSIFLPPNASVVSAKGRDNSTSFTLHAEPKDYLLKRTFTQEDDPLIGLPEELKTIPIVVLINSGSASASEIVTGALQDHKRAVVMGTQSFGKGSVQNVLPLSNGGGLKLTVALYYTPNNRSIQAQGITPDVEIKPKHMAFEVREADLSGHISNPLGGQEVKGDILNASDTQEKPLKDRTDEELEQLSLNHQPDIQKDIQLKKALELIQSPAKWKNTLGYAAKHPNKSEKSNNNSEDE